MYCNRFVMRECICLVSKDELSQSEAMRGSRPDQDVRNQRHRNSGIIALWKTGRWGILDAKCEIVRMKTSKQTSEFQSPLDARSCSSADNYFCPFIQQSMTMLFSRLYYACHTIQRPIATFLFTGLCSGLHQPQTIKEGKFVGASFYCAWLTTHTYAQKSAISLGMRVPRPGNIACPPSES